MLRKTKFFASRCLAIKLLLLMNAIINKRGDNQNNPRSIIKLRIYSLFFKINSDRTSYRYKLHVTSFADIK